MRRVGRTASNMPIKIGEVEALFPLLKSIEGRERK